MLKESCTGIEPEPNRDADCRLDLRADTQTGFPGATPRGGTRLRELRNKRRHDASADFVHNRQGTVT
jgi:hypothetical protein